MPEPSWLYLDNRYIQYANALCAAAELQARGIQSASDVAYPGLPEAFRAFVQNELNPTEAVPQDLYALKQRGQGSPHYEFPVRSAAEQNFTVEAPYGKKLGTLSYAQLLREAYPGAVYYYMARPYRILYLEFKKGLVAAKRTKHFTTKPNADSIAFPDFKNGVLAAWRTPFGFVCETELQVSERVKGFSEQRGQKKMSHEYGPASSFSQKPLTRFFRTTGICWTFAEESTRSQEVADAIRRAFSLACGVEERDLGVGFFKSNLGPFESTPTTGVVIFDATNGSLRLTQRLGAQFSDIVTKAGDQAENEALRKRLRILQAHAAVLEVVTVTGTAPEPVADKEWATLIAANEPAMYMDPQGPIEVTVLGYRYTPHGVMYELESLKDAGLELLPGGEVVKRPPMTWRVLASVVEPIHGTTRLIRVNLMTGEELPIDPGAAGPMSSSVLEPTS